MKTIRHISVFYLLVILFTFCTHTEKNNHSAHKIIFLTKPYSNWIEADKKLSRAESMKYGINLLDSLFEKYFSECEYAYFYKSFVSDTSYGPVDMLSLKKTIEVINSKQEIIKERITTALSKCQSYLPYEDLNIFIFPSFDSTSSEKLGGVGGFTVGSKDITIAIDPFAKGWEEQLELTMAHEFHHAYWTKLNFKSIRGIFSERLIFEGKAEAFSHLVYPEIKSPWDTSLTKVQKNQLWNKIKNKLESTDYVWQDSIMFGIKNYPLCGGYILGRDIVENTLKKNPGIEPKYWTNFSAEYMLKESGYK